MIADDQQNQLLQVRERRWTWDPQELQMPTALQTPCLWLQGVPGGWLSFFLLWEHFGSYHLGRFCIVRPNIVRMVRGVDFNDRAEALKNGRSGYPKINTYWDHTGLTLELQSLNQTSCFLDIFYVKRYGCLYLSILVQTIAFYVSYVKKRLFAPIIISKNELIVNKSETYEKRKLLSM